MSMSFVNNFIYGNLAQHCQVDEHNREQSDKPEICFHYFDIEKFLAQEKESEKTNPSKVMYQQEYTTSGYNTLAINLSKQVYLWQNDRTNEIEHCMPGTYTDLAIQIKEIVKKAHDQFPEEHFSPL